MKLSLQGLVGYLNGKGWKIQLNEKADEEEVFDIEEGDDEKEMDDEIMKKKKSMMKTNAEEGEEEALVSAEELAGLKRLAQVLAKNGKLLEAIEAGTLESALATVPAAAQLVKNAAEKEKLEKDHLIATIKTNSANIYSDDELAGMSVPVLTKLNAQMSVDYSGLGGAVVFQNAEQPLTLPQGLLGLAKEANNGS